MKITIESNALRGVDWMCEIAELLRLAESCPMIEVRRTAGALRESSRPAGDPDAAERRRLASTVPALIEAFTIGVSELDGPESHLTERDENPDLNAISLSLWGRPVANLREASSDLEDVVHLHTHLRHGQDLFVSTDQQMHARRYALELLGIRVRSPAEALNDARIACSR